MLPRPLRCSSLPASKAPPPQAGQRLRRRRRHSNALRSGPAPLKSPSRKFTPQPPPGPRVGHAAAVFPAPRPLAVSHWLGHLRDPPSHSPTLRHVGKVTPIEEAPHCGPAYPAPASDVCVTSGREPLSPRPVSGVRVSECTCLPCLLPGLLCLLAARPHHRPRGDFPALAVELQRPGRAAKGHAAPVRWP